MSNNEKYNAELHAMLEAKREEYTILSKGAIAVWCWDSWDTHIKGNPEEVTALYSGSHAHTLLLKYLRDALSPATRDHLLYIKENISDEAWKILGLTIPKEIKYVIPELDKDEREILQLIIKGIEDSSKYCLGGKNRLPRTSDMEAASECILLCHKIFGRKGEYTNCCYCVGGLSKQEALSTFRKVLAAQKPLEPKLPPHNIIQMPKDKYDALEKWRRKPERARRIFCPHEYGQWDMCADCHSIFPEKQKGGDCPCTLYGNKAVLTIVDKILALGPKSPRVQCLVNPATLCPNDKRYPCDGYSERENYLMQLYSQEEFKPYAAVRVKKSPAYRAGHVYKVVGHINNDQNHSTCAIVDPPRNEPHDIKNLVPIANPKEAIKILCECTGEKTAIEKIKKQIEDRLKDWREYGEGIGASHYVTAYRWLLVKINEAIKEAE